ncbi:MAG: class I SAM-dependent methyltransferase [Pseudomonadota bacterium]
MKGDASSAPDGPTVSFGFEEVAADEKAGRVRGVFSSVADRYDLMNDLMSGGVHRIWKGVLIDRLAPRPGQTLIDVAGGTGDVARAFVETATRRRGAADAPAQAFVCDINEQMVRAGLTRPASRVEGRIRRVTGDAQALPFPDRTAHAYTIAFGIRNVTDRAAALAEARRVLKPGGRFACLEFSHPITDGFQAIYDAYSFNVIPRLGRLVTGDEAAYRYLVESIRRFPSQDTFAQELRAAGFQRVTFENLTGGVAALHLCWRI